MDLEVEFAEDRFAFLVDQFEGVASVAVHPAVSVGRASIWEQEGHLVGGFRSEGDEVPEHVWILRVKKKPCGIKTNQAKTIIKLKNDPIRHVFPSFLF